VARRRGAHDFAADDDVADLRVQVRIVVGGDQGVVGITETVAVDVLDPGDDAAGDPVVAHRHRADLRVGIIRAEGDALAGEDFAELDPAADTHAGDGHVRRGWRKLTRRGDDRRSARFAHQPPLTPPRSRGLAGLDRAAVEARVPDYRAAHSDLVGAAKESQPARITAVAADDVPPDVYRRQVTLGLDLTAAA